MSDMIRIAGLWKAEKDGKVYLSGPIGPALRLLVFPNKFKKEAKHPDYTVFLAPVEQKKDSGKGNDDPPVDQQGHRLEDPPF